MNQQVLITTPMTPVSSTTPIRGSLPRLMSAIALVLVLFSFLLTGCSQTLIFDKTVSEANLNTIFNADQISRISTAFLAANMARDKVNQYNLSPKALAYAIQLSAVALGITSLSGWTDRSTQYPFRPSQQTTNVLTRSQQLQNYGLYKIKSNFKDQGVAGRYDASHAEKQVELAVETLYPSWQQSGYAVGVSKDVCDDCKAWFWAEAQHEATSLYVGSQDPNGRPYVLIFTPNGRVYHIQMEYTGSSSSNPLPTVANYHVRYYEFTGTPGNDEL